MMATTLPLGPWPLGIDNAHEPRHQVFQVPGPGAPAARLTAALDVDLDSTGWPRAREGAARVRGLAAPEGLWALSGRLFYQDGGVLYEHLASHREAGEAGAAALESVTPGTAQIGVQGASGELVITKNRALVSGLSRRVVLAEYGGLVFGSDGLKHFVVDGAAVANWGLPVPTVEVSAVPGALAAGRYLVQASYVDAAGNEGGVSDLAALTLTDGQSLALKVAAARDAATVRVYASGADGRHTSFAAEVPANQGVAILHAVRASSGLPPVTEQMRGPLSGAVGLVNWRAFMLLWRDNFVARSEGAEPHLFHPDNIMQFPARVTACAALTEGLWVGTAAGLWWVSGEGPEAWIPARRTVAAVSSGGRAFPAQVSEAVPGGGLVALFITAEGLVAGLPSGEVLPLTGDRYRFGDPAQATLEYADRGNMRQFFVTLGASE